MGCGASKATVVQPVLPNELEKDEVDTGSKHGGRGESAVSKATTDSGVVMDNGEVPLLPGTVPRKLPVLTASPGLLHQDSPVQERANSSEILEQLLSQGIIPAGQQTERSSRAGKAYDIMLEGTEVPRRRPPARLESLMSRVEGSSSVEAIDQRMRQAEERRKLREDDLKTRLRAKSARVRAPASTPAVLNHPDMVLPAEQLHDASIPVLSGGQEDSADHQVREPGRGEADGRDQVREAEPDGWWSGGDGADGAREDRRADEAVGIGGHGAESAEERGKGDGGAVTALKELGGGQLFMASLEIESDPDFHQTEHSDDVF